MAKELGSSRRLARGMTRRVEKVEVPTAVAVFPADRTQPPRAWAEVCRHRARDGWVMASSFPTARLTLAQIRRSAGRLTAAGVAILISTAFVTVTLLAGGVIQGTHP